MPEEAAGLCWSQVLSCQAQSSYFSVISQEGHATQRTLPVRVLFLLLPGKFLPISGPLFLRMFSYCELPKETDLEPSANGGAGE